MRNNIILIGFMGVGKTEVAKGLAESLNMGIIDTDMEIEREQGRTVSQIFSEDGEKRFRDMESDLLRKLSNAKKHVISTGGGIVLRDGNVKMLKALGPLVLLVSNPEVIEKRLSKNSDRPLLAGENKGQKIREMLAKREHIYNSVADLVVDTSDLSIDEAVKKIKDHVKGAKK